MARLQASLPGLQACHSDIEVHAVSMNVCRRLHRLSAPQTEPTLTNWCPRWSCGWAAIEAAPARQGTHAVYFRALVQRTRRCSPAGGLVGQGLLPPRTPSPSSFQSRAALPAPAQNTHSRSYYYRKPLKKPCFVAYKRNFRRRRKACRKGLPVLPEHRICVVPAGMLAQGGACNPKLSRPGDPPILSRPKRTSEPRLWTRGAQELPF